ncbi:MAG: SDR family oxidoreductase, partial [Ignavibacteria bacterium]|nr:SDR family oxidoreductase [Ignavibacteria bacterium]
EFLSGVLGKEETYNKSFDIGGTDIITYKEMLLHFAKIRGLKRIIIVVPVMTPNISSYWLYFVTAVSFSLAQNLVKSMKVEVIARPNNLAEMLGIRLLSYDESLKLAFENIEQNLVTSSWKDALTDKRLSVGLLKYIEVPVNGCFTDVRKIKITNVEKVMNRIWAIGGKTGWYYGNWMWKVRGYIDKLFGGVGLRRGRTNDTEISTGSALDFWRVLLASKAEKRLLLYAEMKLPGEAWLEFRIDDDKNFIQTATFRPLGLWGRVYWYLVLPFHGFIFNGMIKNIANG